MIPQQQQGPTVGQAAGWAFELLQTVDLKPAQIQAFQAASNLCQQLANNQIQVKSQEDIAILEAHYKAEEEKAAEETPPPKGNGKAKPAAPPA